MRKTHFEHLQKLGPPVVVFQEAFTSRSANVALIRQDDHTGGGLLAKHLLKKKPRSILFLRPMLDWYAVEQREKGLRAAFAEGSKGTEIKTLLSPSEGFEDVQRIVREYLGTRVPDAIAAATDSMAVAALKACEAHGLQVPKDIVITGFNGFDVWRYTRPSLTTVVSPAYEMGRYAGELLLERLDGGGFSKRSQVFPVKLQVGDSA
jgi:LacI family transcriptional regulator